MDTLHHQNNITFLLLFMTTITPHPILINAQDDPSTFNGGSILAMAGDGCVAVAIDKRFGSGYQMVNISPRHVMAPHSRLLISFTGLEGDVRSLMEVLSSHVSSKVSRFGSGFGFVSSDGTHNKKIISARAMSSLTSHILYSRRHSPYYVEPIIAGLERRIVEKEEEDHEPIEEDEDSTKDETRRRIRYDPYLCAMDLIGARSQSHHFLRMLWSKASQSLYGTAEAMWRPGLKPEELVDVCGKAFLSALERDCLSGYGAVVYLMNDGGGIVEYDLAL